MKNASIDNRNRSFFSSLHWKYRARKRLKTIKRNRKKIPPYLLNDDFEKELNYKLWSTKGARFEAAERNHIQQKLSSHSVGFLSAYLIIVNIVQIYGLSFWNLDLTANHVAFISTSISILILLYSQLEGAESFNVKAEKFHSCALEISELYNRLRYLKSYHEGDEKHELLKAISDEYDIILKKCENHKPIDYQKFRLRKPVYHEINFIQRCVIYARYYFSVKLKYHALIYWPIILFVVTNVCLR